MPKRRRDNKRLLEFFDRIVIEADHAILDSRHRPPAEIKAMWLDLECVKEKVRHLKKLARRERLDSRKEVADLITTMVLQRAGLAAEVSQND